MERRFEYPEISNYCNKVLIGPWAQDRANAIQLAPETPNYSTTYKDEFPPKQSTKIDDSIIWDKILTSENSCPISDSGEHGHPSYYENFTTMYDLSYNHFPKYFKSHIPRVWHVMQVIHKPTEEYLPTFGNLTKYGILDYKKHQWKCDIGCNKRECTSYAQQFRPPKQEDYPQRFPLPRWFSTKLEEYNECDLKRKFMGHIKYCENIEDPSKTRKKFCDPITWTCSPDMDIERKKKCVDVGATG